MIAYDEHEGVWRRVYTREHALSEFKRLYEEINKESHLFVGIIPPELIEWAIKALEQIGE